MLEIKADELEGGGQVLRSSISLSSMLSKPVHLYNIRGKRPQPGLKAQHVTCVKAALQVTGGKAEGLEKGSQKLSFHPGTAMAGDYYFDVGTAGSASLVAQTILPVLAEANKESSARITGGTHAKWAPNAHYLKHVFLPLASKFGLRAECSIEEFGWFPKGGGRICLTVKPSEFKPALLNKKTSYEEAVVYSCTSNLPDHVAERQAKEAGKALLELGVRETEVVLERKKSLSPGSAVTVVLKSREGLLGGSALGERGKPSEKVAREAVESVKKEVLAGSPVDRHAADQLLLYAALAGGKSGLLTAKKTMHLETNAWLVKQFIKCSVSIEENGVETLVKLEGE